MVKKEKEADGLTEKITKVSIICQQSKFDDLKEAMNSIGVNGITVTQVLGCGAQKGITRMYRGAELDIVLLPTSSSSAVTRSPQTLSITLNTIPITIAV